MFASINEPSNLSWPPCFLEEILSQFVKCILYILSNFVLVPAERTAVLTGKMSLNSLYFCISYVLVIWGEMVRYLFVVAHFVQ